MPDSSSHVRTPFRRAGRIVAAIAWAGLIFAASSRPDLRVSSDDTIDFVLRKAAHAVVFGVLAVLLARIAGPGWHRRPGVIATAWLGAVAYAVSDEWHQTFVHGRVGHASDVLIDATGAALGLVVATSITAHRSRRTTRELHP